MSRRFHPQVCLPALLVVFVCAIPSAAQSSKSADGTTSDKMTPQTRIQVIRSLQSERVFARVLFPQGDKGLKIKNGVVTPNESTVAQQVAEYGPAAKPGDRCVITDIKINEKTIVLDINGGNKKKGKWYQHIQVSGGGGGSAPLPGTPSPQSLDAKGSSVTLEFDKYVPEINGDQVRAMLAPVFDFKALTPAEAYQKTLPPKLQEAIRDHKILVGMDKEMVTYAKGRPQQRIRDKDDKGEDYEEWIYGTPPEEVDFVRFRGNEVARLEIMTVDGKKVVRTEKEIDLKSKETDTVAAAPDQQKPAPKPQNAPTLRRPGEEPEFPTTTSTHRTTRPQDPNAPPDGTPYPDSTGTTPPPTTPPINPTSQPHITSAS